MPEGDVREAGAADTGEEAVREQDKFLPIANISRIMKRALPTNAKIAKDAKEDVQEFVSEFISFVTSEYVPLLSVGAQRARQAELLPPTATGMA